MSNAPNREEVPHYMVGGIETIDFIRAKVGDEACVIYCLCNIIKYASRANHKGQRKSDLEKIRNYSNIALNILEEGMKEGEDG